MIYAEKNTKKNLAILYKENRDNYKIFTFKNLVSNLLKGMTISFVIFFIVMLMK